jgi:calcineurin-like phosphoesterase family protein
MRWVIGDIHGMIQPLATLLLAVRSADPQARFYFVGDYVNRGRDSKSVIELLLALQREGCARFVRGNHDDIFDLLLSGQCYADGLTEADPIAAFNWFLQFGLDHTLRSYGVERGEMRDVMQRPSPAKLRSVMNVVPDEHRRFIRTLEPVIEEPDMIVAHALWHIADRNDAPYFNDALAADSERRHQLLWGRYTDDELAMPKAWSRPMFFGHTPVGNYAATRGHRTVPIAGPSIVLVDTAAALSPAGRLTAFCVENGRFLQSDPAGRMVRPETLAEAR